MKYIFVFYILGINCSWAIMTKDCIDQGEAFSSGSIVNSLCFNQFKKRANTSQLSMKNHYEVIGYKNIIFVKNKLGDINTIAGSNTTLFNIIFLKFNQSNNLVYVININKKNEKQILIFRLNTHGNVVPRNILDLDVIKDIDSFLVYDEKIWLIDHESNTFLGIDQNVDARSKKASRKVITSHEYIGINDMKWTLEDIVFMDDKILSLDKKLKQIVVYKMRKKHLQTQFSILNIENNFLIEAPSFISALKDNEKSFIKVGNTDSEVIIPFPTKGKYEDMERDLK